MLVINIQQEEIKNFMNKLLKEETFDKLDVRSLILETIVKYEINGNINNDYLKENEERTFIKWQELKPYILNLIKGCKKPKYIKIIFSLEEKTMLNLCENASAMFLNISYIDNNINIITGTSQKNFSLDKMEDKIWEDTVLKFFEKNKINIKIEE